MNRWRAGCRRNRPYLRVIQLDLSPEETAALLRELDNIIDGDRYFLSPRITTLKAIRAKLRPEPVREPPPPIKHHAPSRSTRRPEATPRMKPKLGPPMTLDEAGRPSSKLSLA
jgi:hypothetical protein